MLTVIAPHARPSFGPNLLANFQRQKVAARLLVVENGDAVGTFPRGVENVQVITSEAHQALATAPST